MRSDVLNSNSNNYGKVYDVKDVEIKDLSGAGDTFLAGLVCKYLRTNNIEESINFANECATDVVQKQGVTVISKYFAL